jgi:predicted TIM-barrel fold metal-dependent hydrolase
MTIVDTHIHYWQPSLPDRPWDPSGVDIGPPLSVEQLIADARAAGVDRVVQVTPTVMGTDNRYAFEGAASHPAEVVGVFGRFDPTGGDMSDRLARYASEANVLGVRITAVRPNERNWLSEGVLDPFLRGAGRHGLMVAIYAPGQAAALRAAAERHPETTILVDHMTLRHSDPQPFTAWDGVLALAAVPNLWMKVSYFPEVSRERPPFADVLPRVQDIYDAFGPDRLIWGSNYPPSQRAATYAESVRFFRDLPFIPESDKAKIMGETFLTLAARTRDTLARVRS